MVKVLLIDGNYAVRRSHHATPDLTSPQGHPMGGLFGFLLQLGGLVQNESPEAVFVFWDGGIDPGRRAIFPGYKRRQKPDPRKEAERRLHAEDVERQIKIAAQEILPPLGIPSVRVMGVEADDAIHTARGLISRVAEVAFAIVSGDRDFWQLVDTTTVVLDLFRRDDFQTGTRVSLGSFKRVTGLRDPRQFLDLRTMTGDASDSIPGVRGIGPVSALKILDQVGSIGQALRHLDEVRALGKRFAGLVSLEGQERLARNRVLMDLALHSPSSEEIGGVKHALRGPIQPLDGQEISRVAISLGATQFAANLENWLGAFEDLFQRARGLRERLLNAGISRSLATARRGVA